MHRENFENYYQILGLPDFASIEEVKKAFRKLAKKYHPDKGGDPEKFKKILEAYSILSDKEKKEQFDQYLLFNSKNKINQDETIYGNINIISLKEEPLFIKIEKIFYALVFFFLPLFITILFFLIKNKTISLEALVLSFFFGLIVTTWNFYIAFFLLFIYNEVSEKFFKKYLRNVYNAKLMLIVSILIFTVTLNFLMANFLINNFDEPINKNLKISDKYNKNFYSDEKENNIVLYSEAIENYWDEIKEYIDGYETIEACSNSGCYDLEAYILDGRVEKIYFPNGGYLYFFNAEIDSNGEASDMDQNGNWWDFSLDMDSSIVQDAVSEWANDNGYTLH